jgi:hypothetical protein
MATDNGAYHNQCDHNVRYYHVRYDIPGYDVPRYSAVRDHNLAYDIVAHCSGAYDNSGDDKPRHGH